jgi:hypothetical protein
MAEKQNQKKTGENKDSQNMRSRQVEKSPDKKNRRKRPEQTSG